MFDDNRLWTLMLAFMPAIIYSYIIYFNDRNNIRFRTTLSYLIGGCLSISFLKLIHSVFPHIHDFYFMAGDGTLNLEHFVPNMVPTLWSWFFFAMIQVALIEETSKAMAFRAMTLFRNEEHNKNYTLFSTMFYSCMISVGFAGLENMEYFLNMPGNDTVVSRTFSAVITHMICGLMMGYFIAISRLKKDTFQKWRIKLTGLIVAAMFHGTYDFAVFAFNDAEKVINLGGYKFTMHLFHIIILMGLVIVTILGKTLLNHSIRYGLIQKRHNPSPQEV